ncbi:ATP-binding protein [Rathayibacter sp. YIM 133350]|uniref:sensor histidine kinase n=1 Tax=Rathayibacter sp. YIM 133350 TaxID=3131992 RepID=UPI00307E6ABF
MIAAKRDRAPWTLNRRLLITVVAVLVVVSAIVGIVSVLVLHTSLVERVDSQLQNATERGRVAVGPLRPDDDGSGAIGLPSAAMILETPGQAEGTIALVAADRSVQSAGYLDEEGAVRLMTVAQGMRLVSVPIDGRPHTVDVGGDLGEYRVVAIDRELGGIIFIGLPLTGVNATTAQLSVTIAIVAILGVVIVGVIGSWLIRIALRPLTRVTETATRVARLPLAHGEVALAERVPARDADPRTEVGHVGSALNTMLDHVGAALEARQQSEQKVRQFVADASHELRTPLASIRGYSELTRRSGEELSPDIARALSRIESESVRMTGLVEDLLLLARLDEGRELAHERVDLTALLVDAVGDAHASGPDHVWELDLPDEPIEVSGDAPRLQQVVMNLLANARVHTPEGTTVTVALVDAGDEVRVSVTDDGPGIDPAIADTLFERFARGDASRNRATGSTGLGLAIVRAVVEAHGGTVSVTSEPAATTFTVSLPARL